MSRWNFRSFWVISFYHETTCGLEKVEDTKGMIRSRKSKDKTIKWPKEKEDTMVYKTLHRKLKIEQHEPL